MASLSTDPKGNKIIQFVAGDKKRRTVRLGDHDEAETIRKRVGALNIASRKGRPWDNGLARWVAGLDDELHEKLARVGLVPSRNPLPVEPKTTAPALEPFLTAYIDSRTDHGENTRKTICQSRRLLVKHFGADKPIDAITAADAKAWQNSLHGRYALATIATHTTRAKQMFQHAVDAEILAQSPFGKLKGGTQTNSERQEFVSQETIQAAIDAAPDAEWRLIIALSRYGGLRCPSEHLALTWPDVNWERERFLVRSPKTKRKGKPTRWVPIFPELRPFLAEAFELAEPGTVHVITRYRDRNSNLRTQFMRILRKAGVAPWERLFHNLRASRQTELVEKFPAHVVSKWLGNTVEVATAHYLQTTEEHFRRAAESAADLRDSSDLDGTGEDNENEIAANGEGSELAAAGNTLVRNRTPMQNPGKKRDRQGALHSALQTGQSGTERQGAEGDPRLAVVVAAWPELPQETQDAILGLVEGHRNDA